MTYQHDTNQINQLADKLEDPELDTKGLGWKAAFHLRELQGRIAELEAMLDAVGAGGVGQSIKPQVQADTAQEPVAWRVRPFDYGIGYEGVDALTTRKEQCEIWARKGWKVEPLYTAPQPTENLHCKSTQKRLATLWGYEKARQPLTENEISLAYFDALGSEHMPGRENGVVLRLARAIEAAHGITGGQQ